LRVGRRQGHSSAAETSRNKKSADDRVSVVGALSSAFVAVRTPTRERRRKWHFRRRSFVGVPTPMNADDSTSVGRYGDSDERYGGSEASVSVAGGSGRGRSACGGWLREGRSGGGR
jgi:hypothetical protein